ncbi:MAG: hypothetical protein J6Y89_04525 [Lachnospiraceae bacterium]|nr:hypothetical protein [Lachnospiraceae bacterium]
MQRTKYRDLIWIISIVIFLIFVTEGLVYYGNTENEGLRIALNIENAIKAYTVNTEIKLSDAYGFWQASESTGLAYAGLSVLTVLYMVAVLIAPFCTVALLLTLAEKTWARICNALSKKKKTRILVIGKGENYNQFVKNISKECRVTTYVDRTIEDKEIVELIKAGVDVNKLYDSSIEKVFENLDKKKKFSRFDGILLCDPAGLTNLANYSKLLEIMKKSADKIESHPVYICAEDEVTAEVIRAFDGLHENGFFTVNIINIKEVTVNKTLLEHKIHENRSREHTDVHLGIIGFGDFGQNMLIQGLNMSVLSPDSTIRVDVFDRKMSDILGGFMKKFALEATTGLLENECFPDTFNENLKGYKLVFKEKPFEMDGHVEMHFWETDAKKISFNNLLKDCNEKMPFTYFVIATSDNDSISSASLSVMELLSGALDNKAGTGKNNGNQEKSDKIDIPIIVRTKEGLSMDIIKQDDKENKRSNYNFISVDQDSDIFSYTNLMDSTVINDAKKFNCLYGKIYDLIYDNTKDGQEYVPDGEDIRKCMKEVENNRELIDSQWNQMLYKRESSIAQSLHQSVKRWMLDKKGCAYSVEKDSEFLKKTEHRRWNVYMITHGYKYAPVQKNGKTKDTTRRTHSCIANWENLNRDPVTRKTAVYDILPFMIIEQEKPTASSNKNIS